MGLCGRQESFVIYLEHTPVAPLNSCVRTLWYTYAPLVPCRRERILPSGCVQVILNLARDFLLDCPEGEPSRPMAPSLVVGARSVYEIIDSSDMAELIGVVFHPGGFSPFVSDSADVVSNRNVALEAIWGTAARSLRDRLREVPTPLGKLCSLERFLLDTFAGRFSRNKLVSFALDCFERAPAFTTVREMARQTGWSERRFSQVFREEVGLSPKVWCRIQRFQRALRQLHAGVDVPWAELAVDCGFYDQSHFANEFRAFSGIDATSYTSRRTRWANQIPEP